MERVRGVRSEVYVCTYVRMHTHVAGCLCFFVVCSPSQQDQVLEAIQELRQPSLSDVKVGCWHGGIS